MSASLNSMARRLAEEGVIGERQAQAYISVVIEGRTTRKTAETMGIAPSTVRNHVNRAEKLVREAERTVEIVDELQGDGDE